MKEKEGRQDFRPIFIYSHFRIGTLGAGVNGGIFSLASIEATD